MDEKNFGREIGKDRLGNVKTTKTTIYTDKDYENLKKVKDDKSAIYETLDTSFVPVIRPNEHPDASHNNL